MVHNLILSGEVCQECGRVYDDDNEVAQLDWVLRFLNAGGGTTTGVEGLGANRSQQLSSYAPPAPRNCPHLNNSSNIF